MSRATDPAKRFERSIKVGERPEFRPDLGRCVIFTGASNGNGYGQFYFAGKNGYAHRYAWEVQNGPIPDELTVDHLCRVRNCVNVDHMELVTGVENYLRGVAARETCRNGHPWTEETSVTTKKGRYCTICKLSASRRSGDKRSRSANGLPNRKIRYDQAAVREQIHLVRFEGLTIANAARAIGCNPNYLGRRIWRETRAAVLDRDGQRCLRCGGRADDVHHRTPRGSGGSTNSRISFGMDNLASLCRPCHQFVESHRIHGISYGWLVSRHGDPSTIPLISPATESMIMLTAAGSAVINNLASFEDKELPW